MAKKSVITDEMDKCFFCGSQRVQIHHCIYGRGKRQLADQDGYIVLLCWEHHLGRNGVHFNRELDLALKQICQRHFEKTHTRQEFIQRYGRSYL